MPEEFCDVGRGVTLCYETFGDPDDTPILLIMGLATQMIAWHEDFCEQLAERGLLRRALRQPRHRPLDPLRLPPADGGPDAAPQGRAGAVHALRHGRGRRRPAPRARDRPRPRRRRLDGRHDRPDAGRRASRGRPLADLDHVDDRQPLARPARAIGLPLPAPPPSPRPRRLHPAVGGGLRPGRINRASIATSSTSASEPGRAFDRGFDVRAGGRQLGAIVASGDRTQDARQDQGRRRS